MNAGVDAARLTSYLLELSEALKRPPKLLLHTCLIAKHKNMTSMTFLGAMTRIKAKVNNKNIIKQKTTTLEMTIKQTNKQTSKQTTRGHDVVEDGWAGVYNPQPHPNHHTPPTHTL